MVIKDGDILSFPRDGMGDSTRERECGRWRWIEGEGVREGRQRQRWMLHKGERAHGRGHEGEGAQERLEGRDHKRRCQRGRGRVHGIR